MTDIVERLRGAPPAYKFQNPMKLIKEYQTMCEGAADEIERLRSWLEEIAKSDDEVSEPEAVCLTLIAKYALAGNGLDDD